MRICCDRLRRGIVRSFMRKMHDRGREIGFRWCRGRLGRWGDLLWVGGGNPVVSRCATTGYKLAPLPGCEFVGCEVPVVSLVPSSTTGYELASLRDEEAGEGERTVLTVLTRAHGPDGRDGRDGRGRDGRDGRDGRGRERRGLVGALRAQREL